MGCGASNSAQPPGQKPSTSEKPPSHEHAKTDAKLYGAFISHFKAEGAMEARWLQTELSTKLGRKVFIDSDDLSNLASLKQNVIDSDVLVLVQTRGVLERPWCLVELITALENGIPIVGVCVTSGAFAYDFAAATSFLESLDVELERRNPGAADLLQEEGIHVTDAAWKLSLTLPGIISTPFNPSASKNMLDATLKDVVLEIEKAAPLEMPSKDKFVRRTARGQHGSSAHHSMEADCAASAAHPSSGTAPPSSGAAPPSSGAMIPPEVPELPAALQSRPTLLDELMTSVLGNNNSSGTTSLVGMTRASATTAAHGMGGVGKTTVAVQLIRHPKVRMHFEWLLWVSVSADPDIMQLLNVLHSQLTGDKMPPTVEEEREAIQLLQQAARGRKALLVLDDCWQASHVRLLNQVDVDAGSKCVITTRVRSLSEGGEVSCGLLSTDEAVSLLLNSAGLAHYIEKPPAAALEAVECCGRLALALPSVTTGRSEDLPTHSWWLIVPDNRWFAPLIWSRIAASMIRELEDVWQTELVPLLKAELSEELSVEARIVNASLRCVDEKQRGGVESLFVVFGCFAEDSVVPAVVLDALAPLICERAGVAPGKRKVRQWLQSLLKASLLNGSIAHGLSTHDLVRDVAMARADAAEGGMLRLQRQILTLLRDAHHEIAGGSTGAGSPGTGSPGAGSPGAGVQSADGGGEAESAPSGNGGGDSGSRAGLVGFVLGGSFRHHVLHAQQPGVPLHDDALLMSMLTHQSAEVCACAASGIGRSGLQAAIRTCEACGAFLDAARLWYAVSTLRGLRAGSDVQQAWAALSRVDVESAESRALEGRVLSLLLLCTEGGLDFNSPEYERVLRRVAELGADAAAGASEETFESALSRSIGVHMTGALQMGFVGFVGFGPDVLTSAHATWVESCALFERAAVLAPDDIRADGALQFSNHLQVICTRIHTLPDFQKDAFFGAGGAKLRANIARYDFEKMHASHKSGEPGIDVYLYGHNEAGLLLFFDDVEAARVGWRKQTEAWRRIQEAVRGGERAWPAYVYEQTFAGLGACVATMLAAGEWHMAREYFGYSCWAQLLHDDAAEMEMIASIKKAPIWWQASVEVAGDAADGHRYAKEASLRLQARALAAVLDWEATVHNGNQPLPPRVGLVADDDDATLRSWLPPLCDLLHDAEREWHFHGLMRGAAHPALLCATLHARRLGEWDAAAAIADGFLAIDNSPSSTRMEPLARIEAWRLLARCHEARADIAATSKALEAAAREAAAVGYVFMEQLTQRELLALQKGPAV